MSADTLELVEANLASVNVKRYLDDSYDKFLLYKRALTIFRSSYYGYESLLDKSYYESKLSEYVDLMQAVFDQKKEDVSKLIEEIDKEIEHSDLFVIQIRIGDCKIQSKLNNPKVVAYHCIGMENFWVHSISNDLFEDNVHREISLKNEDSFVRSNVSFEIKFSQLKYLRVEGKELQIEFQAQGENGQYFVLPNKLVLAYSSIHPEGYRTWFNFDNNVECLVVVHFSIKNDYSGSRISLTEHTQLIWNLFQYRFREHCKSNNSGDKLLLPHKKCEKRTSSLHQEINPHSNDAFWPSNKNPVATDMDIQRSSSSHCLSRAVHCHELEFAYDDNDDPIEEEFCRCSEWCNVSAFYLHNPILRFLMVQFTNFYIRTMANLPSSYMCAISHLFANSSKKQISVSLLYILNSILQYMKISYSKKIQFLVIDVCSYKFIRSVEMNDLVKMVEDKEPFNSEVLTCINNYFQIFMYLHSHIGKMHQIVPNKYIDQWYDLLYEIIYKGYNSYLHASTERALKCMKEYSCVPLFFQYKCSTKLASYDYDMEEVIQEREKIYSNQYNKFNVEFNCHPYIQILLNISKFIVEIYLPLANSEKKTQKCHFAIKFDKLLLKELDSLISYENEPLAFLMVTEDDPTLDCYHKKLYMLFTLKLYSLAFAIQQYFTSSLVVYNRVAFYGYLMHVPSNLRFVFKTDWIEQVFCRNYPMENLFVDQSMQLREEIENFYKFVWSPAKLVVNDSNSVLNGTLQECLKLCLWWKIDGKNLTIFKKLLETHKKIFSDCVNRADNLFNNEFSFVNHNKLCKVNHLLKDNIALNLVQAVCFCFVKVTYSLVKSIHSIQNHEYINASIDFTLIRPGIIDLISTLDVALKYLNKLKILFIAYNDQFDFICRSISSTQFILTSLYRDLYVRLVWQWLCQMEPLIEKATCCHKVAAVLKFNLIVGIHFIVRFYRHFRHDYCEFRKKALSFDEKLRNMKNFDYNKYKEQVDELFKYEINSNSSMPFLSESLENDILDALEIKTRTKTPFEQLKQMNINIEQLQQ